MGQKSKVKKKTKSRCQIGAAKKRKELTPLSNVPLPVETKDSDLEEDQLSDQDLTFVAQHADKLNFLERIEQDELDAQVLNKQRAEMDKRQARIDRQKGKKEQSPSSEAEEEMDAIDIAHAKQQNQRATQMQVSEVKKENRSRLPIKTADGRITYEPDCTSEAADMARKVEGVIVDDAFVEEEEADDVDSEMENMVEVKQVLEQDDTEQEDGQDVGTESALDQMQEFKETEMSREELKMQIAVHANKMLTRAEKSVAPLKKLLMFCTVSDPQIQKLAMLSCMRVFKDIIPGYRIQSKATSAQQAKKIEKEHLKTKEYETLLLQCYQAYLKILLKSSQNKQQNRKLSTVRVCVKCLCGLAESLHHFNYGTDLIKAVVGWMQDSDQIIVRSCSNSIAEMIKTDTDGYRTLEAVQFIGDLVKRQKCCCSPLIVESILDITFKDLPVLSKEDKGEKRVSKHRRKKMYKIRDEMEKRGKEFDVHKPLRDKETENKAKLQSQTVEALFEIFFRILKRCSHHMHSRSCYEHEESMQAYISKKCPLLAVSLKGLAKHAHIMSVEYFEDLLAMMTKLLKCQSLPFYERFQSLSTIANIFKGQGDALTIDRKDFYEQLYIALGNWRPDTIYTNEIGPFLYHYTKPSQQVIHAAGNLTKMSNPGLLLVHVCTQMLCETKTSDFGRLAAFAKRILSIGLHQETGIAMGLCAVVNKLLVKYRRLRALLDGESETPIDGSVYDPIVDDPCQSSGLLTSLWELPQFARHYNPHMAQAARQLLKIRPDMADSASGYMTVVLSSIDGPPGVTVQYSTLKGTYCPIPSLSKKQACQQKKRQRQYSPFFEQLQEQAEGTEINETEIEKSLEGHMRKKKRIQISIQQALKRESLKTAVNVLTRGPNVAA